MVRTTTVLKNSIAGIAGNIITLLLAFITRTVFIVCLGREYLGISTLFSQILMILSLAELGIGSAITFAFYKPIAEGDTAKIQALMRYYKNAYKIIATVVLLLGVCLLPALPYIVRLPAHSPVNPYPVYFLYILNTTVSYLFFAYKNALLRANQKEYVIKVIGYYVSAATCVAQILILVLFRNFIAYLIVNIAANIVLNLIVSRKVDKLYPDCFSPHGPVLDKKEKAGILANMKALFLYKLSGVVDNSAVNIIISAFIGSVVVGVCGNYALIIGSVNGFISIIFSSCIATLGNMHATERVDNRKDTFDNMYFLCFWLYGLCSICLAVLTKPFIWLWLGPGFLVDDFSMYVMMANFYILGMENPTSAFRTACGMFTQYKYRPLFSALLNIVLSIVLLRWLGLAGIFLGITISRMTTYFIFDPKVVCRDILHTGTRRYYLHYALYTGITVLVGLGVWGLCSRIQSYSVAAFAFKLLICLVLPNLIFLLVFRRQAEFRYFSGLVRTYASKIWRVRRTEGER